MEGYPPFSWPGGSMVVDYDGRILAQADPGPGEKIVVAPIDVRALREVKTRSLGHDMKSHFRPEAHAYASKAGLKSVDAHPITKKALEDRIRRSQGDMT